MQNIDKEGVSFDSNCDGKYLNIDRDGISSMTDEPTNETISITSQQQHTLRYYVRSKLREFFEDDDHCNLLETAIFNYTIKSAKNRCWSLNWKNYLFKNLYKQKFISVYMNLTDTTNDELYERIAIGDIELQTLPFLSPYELKPSIWKDIFDKMISTNRDISTSEVIADGLFTCGKCKSKKVHHYQMQTRSADESMTTYCTCTECKNVWKF